MNRCDLESKGLFLRTPGSRLVLEVPAEFGWDSQDLYEQMKILEVFGFHPDKELKIERRDVSIGTLCQISQ